MTLIHFAAPETAAEARAGLTNLQQLRREEAARNRGARFFTPGVGGVGNITRAGEGQAKYYGDYTDTELAQMEARENRSPNFQFTDPGWSGSYESQPGNTGYGGLLAGDHSIEAGRAATGTSLDASMGAAVDPTRPWIPPALFRQTGQRQAFSDMLRRGLY